MFSNKEVPFGGLSNVWG